MQGRGLRAWARGTVIALLLRWPFPPRPRPRHCSLVRPVPAILVRLLVVIIVVCSLSLLSFVPPPPPHLVLTVVVPAPVSSGALSPFLLLLSCPGPGCHPRSSFSYLPGSSLSTRDPPCEQGLAAVWRVLGRLRHQHF